MRRHEKPLGLLDNSFILGKNKGKRGGMGLGWQIVLPQLVSILSRPLERTAFTDTNTIMRERKTGLKGKRDSRVDKRRK